MIINKDRLVWCLTYDDKPICLRWQLSKRRSAKSITCVLNRC